jgi:hypothetical protein
MLWVSFSAVGWPGPGLRRAEFGKSGVLLPVEQIVKMAECLLLGNDSDVIFGGVCNELAGLGLAEGTAGRPHERDRGVLHGVLKVERVGVELVGGDGADLLLLKVKVGDGTAGEVVADTAVPQRRPIANVCGVKGGAGAFPFNELLDGLNSIEEAFRGSGGDGKG